MTGPVAVSAQEGPRGQGRAQSVERALTVLPPRYHYSMVPLSAPNRVRPMARARATAAAMKLPMMV